MNILWLFCWVSLAFAKQVDHSVKKGDTKWVFDVEWTTKNGKHHNTHFALDADLIKEDLNEPLYFRVNKAGKYQAKKINKWAKKQKGVTIKASSHRGKVSVEARGQNRKKVRKKMKQAEEISEKALQEYLRKNGYLTIRGKIMPDHIRHIKQASDDLAPLLEALGGVTQDPRVFARKALMFTQSIPYERRGSKPDKYRRPLSSLGRNKADCDSKAVLFLALMHEGYPDMPLAIVYISGHAFAAIGIEPKKGDVRFRAEGEKWVAVEPVGPALFRVGKLSAKSRRHIRTKRYQIRTL
jgi:hypothetical protein